MPESSTAKPFRIGLITFSAPWEGNPTTGTYNLRQAEALNAIGCVAEIFVCTPKAPRFLELFKPSLKRLNDRPAEWTYQGVRGHAVRSYFLHPEWVRTRVAERRPRIAEWLMRIAYRRKLLRELALFRPHAIYVHDGVMLGSLAASLAARLGIPFGIIEHETVTWDRSTPVGRRYAEVASRARVVFGVGVPSVRALRVGLGLNNARLSPNGIAAPAFDRLQSKLPDKYAGRKIVLSAGSPVPLKGHEELVRAFAEANVPDSLLLLVSSAVSPEVQALVCDLGLGERFEHLLPMPQKELQQLMAWARVYAMPSRKESFGMVFGEAIAAGTRVILTDACGIASHLTPGIHGWILNVGDHAALVGALRESLGAAEKPVMDTAARQALSDVFTWETSARTIVAGLRGEAAPAQLLAHIAAVESKAPGTKSGDSRLSPLPSGR